MVSNEEYLAAIAVIEEYRDQINDVLKNKRITVLDWATDNKAYISNRLYRIILSLSVEKTLPYYLLYRTRFNESPIKLVKFMDEISFDTMLLLRQVGKKATNELTDHLNNSSKENELLYDIIKKY